MLVREEVLYREEVLARRRGRIRAIKVAFLAVLLSVVGLLLYQDLAARNQPVARFIPLNEDETGFESVKYLVRITDEDTVDVIEELQFLVKDKELRYCRNYQRELIRKNSYPVRFDLQFMQRNEELFEPVKLEDGKLCFGEVPILAKGIYNDYLQYQITNLPIKENTKLFNAVVAGYIFFPIKQITVAVQYSELINPDYVHGAVCIKDQGNKKEDCQPLAFNSETGAAKALFFDKPLKKFQTVSLSLGWAASSAVNTAEDTAEIVIEE